MTGATWALRVAREVYHPWYAQPDRLFAAAGRQSGAPVGLGHRAGSGAGCRRGHMACVIR